MPHIGQLFYQEDLREAVEATSPYSSNTVTVITNDEDIWAPLQVGDGTTSFDPFPEYVYLSEGIEDGLFAWIRSGSIALRCRLMPPTRIIMSRLTTLKVEGVPILMEALLKEEETLVMARALEMERARPQVREGVFIS